MNGLPGVSFSYEKLTAPLAPASPRKRSRAAAPFYQRHPILSALVLHTWLTR
jgi:hypothetical protein